MEGPEGAALLVAGYELEGTSTVAVQRLGLVGEALLATGAAWKIQRLSPAGGDRLAPNRAALKRHITELTQAEVEVVVLVCAGVVADTPAGPALVSGPQHAKFPDDATVPLAWIGDRVRACIADRALVVIAGAIGATGATGAGATDDADRDRDRATAWLAALRTDRANDVIAAHAAPIGSRALPAIDALLGGLTGAGVDPTTGTITMRSIAAYLERAATGIAVQASVASQTLASPPPLAWNGILTTRSLEGRTALARPAPRHADPKADDLAGVVLPGRFRLDEKLASGSFGTVYRAHQLAVERDVAVKVMHAGIDPGSDDGRLFVQEIRAVGRLDHDNIVRIHQADVTPDGRLFFAMELLRGRDLARVVADGVVPVARAVELVRQLLAGLGAAHDAGLVHADVKPANAIVVPRGDGERVVLVDFGMARLRAPGETVEAPGGTPAFMAPEQLANERIDGRADLFAAGLVLVHLLTGWRRQNQLQLAPSLDTIDDPIVRAALTRALAIDPAERFQTAADFIAALAGETRAETAAPPTRLPFRHLAPYTEDDRGRLHGRDRDLDILVDHVLYRRAVVYTAPSGAGKTSLLRAGLVPRLGELGARPVYLTCRGGDAAELARAIDPDATSIADAIARWHAARRGKLVVIVDQAETALDDPSGEDLIAGVLSGDRWPADADVAVVLAVREDFLARLLARVPRRDDVPPIVRLGPLDRDGARDAIVAPLGEARLAIEPALLDVLLADLARAAAAIGAELGWGSGAGAYPPHLQLACSALYDALPRDETTITLAHYRALGGFDAIVGEHLDRVLDRELDDADVAIARDIFLALVTASHTRAQRGDAELVDIAGHARVAIVLEALRTRGLVVRLRGTGGEPVWELVHDSLVPRVLAWIDRRDLARRRAIELVRYHLRRSTPETPSLLSRPELRELSAHTAAVTDLDREWTTRDGWTPTRLVARSRRAVRARYLAIAIAILAALGVAAIPTLRWLAARDAARREQSLRDRDLGRFALELAPFDWNADTLTATPVPASALPDLSWQIHDPDPDDPDSPGAPMSPNFVIRRGSSTTAAGSRIDHVEARSTGGFLVIAGRGREGETCSPSVIPLRRLPGYAQRDREPTFHIAVPTCVATRTGMIEIPEGSFVYGGSGDPPSAYASSFEGYEERQVVLDRFSIDRTEVTNAAFAQLASMEKLTGIFAPDYPETEELAHAGEAAVPVHNLTWPEARAFCRYLGKTLPTTEQWQKSLRGGLTLGDRPNPMPRRNLPWGAVIDPPPARLADTGERGPATTGATSGDISPYGVMDLAGNVQEWTRSLPQGEPPTSRFRVIRGADWGTKSESLIDFMAINNLRPVDQRWFTHGVRCAIEVNDAAGVAR